MDWMQVEEEKKEKGITHIFGLGIQEAGEIKLLKEKKWSCILLCKVNSFSVGYIT